MIIPNPVGLGDIPAGLSAETVRQKIRDEYLRDPSVTVVLVGTETWSRKHVDWEIGSTLRDTERNPRGGLLGVLLPTYVEENRHQFDSASEEGTEYYQYTLPPRLAQNVQRGYAPLIRWTDSPEEIAGWVHETYRRKRRIQPDNSYPSFVNNRGGKRWYP